MKIKRLLDKIADYIAETAHLNKEFYKSEKKAPRQAVRSGSSRYSPSASCTPKRKTAEELIAEYSGKSRTYRYPQQLSAFETQQISAALKQARDSAELINSTVKPDVFFKRLHLTLEALLFLKTFEGYASFSSTPTKDYDRIILNLSDTVDDFIDRATAKNEAETAALKTEAARKRKFVDFATKLISAFDVADTFWSGNGMYPRYTGRLYTDWNYSRVNDIWDKACSDEYRDIDTGDFEARAKALRAMLKD